MPNNRQQLSESDLFDAHQAILKKLLYRMQQKGLGCMASNHEILGVIQQETTEYEEAVHTRAPDDEKVAELVDIAVGCIYGIASISTGGIDW